MEGPFNPDDDDTLTDEERIALKKLLAKMSLTCCGEIHLVYTKPSNQHAPDERFPHFRDAWEIGFGAN